MGKGECSKAIIRPAMGLKKICLDSSMFSSLISKLKTLAEQENWSLNIQA